MVVEHDGVDAARLPLLERLADADHHAQARVQRLLRLRRDERARLALVRAALRVAEDDPLHAVVREHRRRELARVGPHARRRAVLGRNSNILAQRAHDAADVDRRHADDDLAPGGNVARAVQGGDERRGRLLRAVTFPVASNQVLLAGVGGLRRAGRTHERGPGLALCRWVGALSPAVGSGGALVVSLRYSRSPRQRYCVARLSAQKNHSTRRVPRVVPVLENGHASAISAATQFYVAELCRQHEAFK